MNDQLHIPERLEGESMADYRARQAQSRHRARMVRHVRGGHSNPKANNARRVKREIGARKYRMARKETSRALAS